WTSAGTAAGIDLCLHLVRLAHGAETAATVARSMVTAPFRTGTQDRFIQYSTPSTNPDTLAAVHAYALRHLHEPLTVAGLARHAGMAPRTFARHFTAATGTTPLHWLHDQHRRRPAPPRAHRPPHARGRPPRRLRQRGHD